MVSDAGEQAEWPTEGRGRPRSLRAGGEASEKTGVSDAREQAEWPTEGRGRPRSLRAGGEASEKTGVSDVREQAEWPTALAARNWYERELGWATADGPALRLRTGLRFDVLEVPTAAGMAVLRRMRRTGPVACAGDRVVL